MLKFKQFLIEDNKEAPLQQELQNKGEVKKANESDKNFVGPPKSLNYDVLSDEDLNYRKGLIAAVIKLNKEEDELNSAKRLEPNFDPTNKLNIIQNRRREMINSIFQQGKNRSFLDPRIMKYYDEQIDKYDLKDKLPSLG